LRLLLLSPSLPMTMNLIEHETGELRRTPLLRGWVNRPWVLLRVGGAEEKRRETPAP
jgi:hypothetical protein